MPALEPAIPDHEYDALQALGDALGGRCGEVRPGTLGYQRCWRIDGHPGDHVSQDSRSW